MTFTFYKDQFGVHVYYSGGYIRNQALKINDVVDFDPATNCVVPLVTRVSEVRIENKVTGYIHRDTGTTMSTVEYNNTIAQHESIHSMDIEEEVKYERLKREWDKQSEKVEVHVDHEFEIVDIEYPADERLIPMRHLGGEKVNYFTVDGATIARNLAHSLCQGADLTHSHDGKQRNTYDIPTHSGLEYWKIEGNYYGKHATGVQLNSFTGHLVECREFINDVETHVRQGFDEWQVSSRPCGGVSLGVVVERLDEALNVVKRIDPKIRTRHSHERAIEIIQEARADFVRSTLKELNKEDSNND